MKLGSIVLAAVAALGMTSAAKAADWNGFYFGKLLEGSFIAEEGGLFGLGGVAGVVGYNWDDGQTIYGIDEMFVFTPFDEYMIFSWQKMGRIGTRLTENAMIYGAGGLGWTVLLGDGDNTGYAALGGGVEVALNEETFWRTHAQLSIPFESSSYNIFSIGTGIVWNFN